MAGEGEFPKAGGDVAYASEANRFASAGRYVELGSTGLVVGSATAYQEAGSILIGAGSLTNPCSFVGMFVVNRFGGAHSSLRITVSGASAHGSILVNDQGNATNPVTATYQAIAGSPYFGRMLTSHTIGQPTDSTNQWVSCQELINLDTSQAVVIDLSIINNGESGFVYYDIQSFRSTNI
jgi:hypothetical protein